MMMDNGLDDHRRYRRGAAGRRRVQLRRHGVAYIGGEFHPGVGYSGGEYAHDGGGMGGDEGRYAVEGGDATGAQMLGGYVYGEAVDGTGSAYYGNGSEQQQQQYTGGGDPGADPSQLGGGAFNVVAAEFKPSWAS
jgi:hypothetical protein